MNHSLHIFVSSAVPLAFLVFFGASLQLRAARWYVVDAGYVALEGYQTQPKGAANPPEGDPRLGDIHHAFIGPLRAGASKMVGGYLSALLQDCKDVEAVPLEGPSLSQNTVDPGAVTLWLGTVSNLAAVPEVFLYQTDARANELLAVSFGFFLIHLKSSAVVFSQQAMVILPSRNDRPVSAEGFLEKVLAGLAVAVKRDSDAGRRFRGALEQGKFLGRTASIYSVGASTVELPESVRQLFPQYFAAAAGTYDLGMRRLIALEIANGLSTQFTILPMMPDKVLEDLQIGGQQRASIWATFNLGALQTSNLPAGGFLDRSRDGLVIVSGRLPAPDFRIHASFDYSEREIHRTAFQRTHQGEIRLKLEERGEQHRKELRPPVVEHANANYALSQPNTARALLVTLKKALQTP